MKNWFSEYDYIACLQLFILHFSFIIKNGRNSMKKENVLIDKSRKFALEIMSLCNSLKNQNILISQLLRSGTSIGANIHEANYAHGKADFVAKLQIALKECYETEYWLDLFYESKLIVDDKIIKDCIEIKKI